MTEISYKIAGIGELLWDVTPNGKQLGGAPSNCIYHALDSGIDGYVVSAVGNDQDGRDIKSRVKELGVSVSYIHTAEGYPTGTVGVELDDKGKPDYLIYEDVAWDHIEWSDLLRALASRLDGLTFGSLCQRSKVSRNTILKFLESTSSDCIRVFDVNLRKGYYNRKTILESLERSDVVKLNDEELPVLAGYLGYKGSQEEILKQFLEGYQLDLIAYTKGSEGSVLMSPTDQSYLEVPETKVADTIGAGDAFTGILLKGLLQGIDLREIHKTATQVSAYVCTQQGATPLVPVELLKF